MTTLVSVLGVFSILLLFLMLLQRGEKKKIKYTEPNMGRTMYIMRGLPGSGKSHLAKQINNINGAIIYSTDSLFIRYIESDKKGEYEWKYIFDKSKLGEYHRQNKLDTAHSIDFNESVIIDNTNTTFGEMKDYLLLALMFGYNVRFIEPDSGWKNSVDECFKKNTHGVPLDAIKRMKRRFESTVDCRGKMIKLFETVLNS